MKSQSIDATIFASKYPNVAKRTSTSGFIFSSLLLLVGLTALIFSNSLEEHASALTMVSLLLGTILVIWGIFRLVWRNKVIVYVPTGSVAKGSSFFFDLKHLNDLKECITSGQFSLGSDIKSEDSGNIRMDVMLSEDGMFAAVQLFQFVPYTYSPITSVHYYTNGEAVTLSSFLVESGCITCKD